MKNNTENGAQKEELGQVLFLEIRELRPSFENDKLYKPVNPKDPDLIALAQSIKQRGIIEPLVVTADFCPYGQRWIVSGHRRYAAAKLAGLHRVPVRISDIRSDAPDFVAQLREFNRQREKTLAEKLREEVVSANPEESYRRLVEYREQKATLEDVDCVKLIGRTTRARISKAKEPMLRAIDRVLQERRSYWPLSDRQIHYALLNNPPLIHASKPKSTYRNDKSSYKALTELLTRARLVGRISMNAIADPTRPVTVWNVHDTTTPFIRSQLDDFLKQYYRNLQQSQPNHIEILGEKNTVESILRPVASDCCVPLTIGRGYCSLQPRYEMAKRFEESGKEKLILLILSDFDPDGEEICHSFARSMRDEFGCYNIATVKVGLTQEQVQRFQLPPNMTAKESSTHYKKFVEKYGSDVYELEALPPEILQSELRAALDKVMDCDLFNEEVEAEKEDAKDLDEIRQKAHLALADEIELED